MPNDDVQDFADMSAALTGFQSGFLRPKLDPHHLSLDYFNVATHRTHDKPVNVQTLLAAYRAIKTQPPQQIANTLLETASTSPSPQAQLAQSIVKMWYTASWYDPAPPAPADSDMVQVVSSAAYTHGLVWNVMQSHPMGYSEFSFGYWNTPPGPLSQFGVNTDKGGAQ